MPFVGKAKEEGLPGAYAANAWPRKKVNAAATGSNDKEVPKQMLKAIIVILLVLWLLGLVIDVAGSAIHLLLLIAAAVLVYQLLTGRRRV